MGKLFKITLEETVSRNVLTIVEAEDQSAAEAVAMNGGGDRYPNIIGNVVERSLTTSVEVVESSC